MIRSAFAFECFSSTLPREPLPRIGGRRKGKNPNDGEGKWRRTRMGEKVVENRGEGRNTVADDFAPTAFASSLGAGRHLHREETAAGLPRAFLDGPRVLTYSVACEPATRGPGRKTGRRPRARPIPENHRLRREEERELPSPAPESRLRNRFRALPTAAEHSGLLLEMAVPRG